jgi:ribonucleoside-triphosphate reductase
MYNSELPYLTIAPSFSMCSIHGFLKGDTHGVCPKCKEEAEREYRAKLEELTLKKKQLTEQLIATEECIQRAELPED